MRRTLSGGALMLIVGIGAATFAPVLAFLVVVPAGVMLWKMPEEARRTFLFLLLFYLCGSFSLLSSDIILAGGQEFNVTQVKPMEAEVLSVSTKEDHIRLECRLVSFDGKPVSPILRQKVLMTTYREIEDSWKLTGKRISFRGTLSEPEAAGNPRCFDYGRYLRSRGITHIGTVQGFQEVPGEDNSVISIGSWKRRILGYREGFLQNLNATDRTKGVVQGLLFGDTASMDEEIYDDFRSNGTAHVLAVSGLHVGVLYGIYRKLKGKKESKFSLALLVFFLLFYGTITLWAVSVTRAVLMILIKVLGDVLDRRYDLLSALSLASILILLHQPYALFGVGFQMSFLAMMLINFLTPVLSRVMPEELAVMLAVQMGMIPFTAYTFNYVPLLSLVCNVPVIFLLSIVVPAGLLALLMNIFIGGSGIVGTSFCGLTEMMIDWNQILSQEGLFSLHVVSPPLGLVAAVYLGGFFACSELSLVKGHRREFGFLRSAGVCILGIALIFGTLDRTPFDRAFAVMVDVGQGDCLHLRTASGKQVLLDGGGRKEYNVGKKTLMPYLLKNRYPKVELAMATHLHTDHYQGLQELEQVYPVEHLVKTGKAGQEYELGEGESIRILWPVSRDDSVEDENRNSMIFRVTIRGIRMLVTGDINEEGERMLLEHYKGTTELNCDVLKVAHHGSKYSSAKEFLEAVNPDIAIIGVGRNTYGHPTKETLDRLKACGAQVFRTDTQGAVGLIRTKEGLQVVTNKQP